MESDRDRKKAEHHAARDVAGKLAESTCRLLPSLSLRVSSYAAVQPVEGGAFVECMMFVPAEKINDWITYRAKS